MIPANEWMSMKMLRTPLKQYGGKEMLCRRILPLLPSHSTYVEPFFGAGSIFFAKTPCETEVINDLDSDQIDQCIWMQDSALRAPVLDRLRSFENTREQFRESILALRSPGDATSRRAHYFYAKTTSFNGALDGWSRPSRPCDESAFAGRLSRIPPAGERLAKTTILNRHFRDVLFAHDSAETLFFLDPPYVPETRGRPKRYLHEMGTAEHAELLAIVKSLTGKVVLSGYASDMYSAELGSWHFIQMNVAKHSTIAGRKQRAVETLWFNDTAWADRSQGRPLIVFDAERDAA